MLYLHAGPKTGHPNVSVGSLVLILKNPNVCWKFNANLKMDLIQRADVEQCITSSFCGRLEQALVKE